MSLFGWIFYAVLGIIFYILLVIIDNKFKITKIQKFIFSIILLIISTGICFRFAVKYTDNIFLSFVFLMITDIIYSSYFIEKDFFDRDEKNIFYYILLVFIGFIINQEFFNKVTQVFLTGEDLRLVLWFLSIIFIYSFIKEKNILDFNNNTKTKFMSVDSILVTYSRFKHKYGEVCDFKDRGISNIVFALMIYRDYCRSKMLRNYDYFIFRLNGNKRKLGIMQIDSSKFITDADSIEIVYKDIMKLYKKNNGSTKTKKDIGFYSIIDEYCKEESDKIKYIFDIIQKI